MLLNLHISNMNTKQLCKNIIYMDITCDPYIYIYLAAGAHGPRLFRRRDGVAERGRSWDDCEEDEYGGIYAIPLRRHGEEAFAGQKP